MELERILNAESVAVIGASRDEKKRGFQTIKILLDEKYEGDIYPVNPREESILGLRCYKSPMDIEKPVDVALISTPAQTVPPVLRDCGKKGIAGAVIVAGGFGELGEEGKKLENEIVDTAKKYNIRVIGPNTSGIINVKKNLNLVGIQDVPKGDIALLTQSGNIALHIITEAKLKSQKGFSYYVGVGNEADVKFHEYLEFFKNDPDTKLILMYVEGLRDGRKFLQEAYKTTTEKPIVLLKSGRSSTGKKSAGSHTGALAGISEVARTSFERAGIINIENSDQLFPVAETLSSLPPIYNNRIAILADGGGHATIAADLLTDHGVQIPALSKKTQASLREILPSNATVQNPIDVAGGTDSNPAIFADCARILLEDRNVGGLLIVGLFGGYGIRFAERLRFSEEDAAHQMGKLVKRTGKPIVLHSLYNFAKPHSLELLRYYDIPVYDSLDIACKCTAVLSQYGHYSRVHHAKASFVFNWGTKAKKEGETIISKAKKEGRNVLLEHEGKELLQLHGAPVSLDRLAEDTDDAVKIANELDGKVALKIVSPDILHKSDAGGVELNLETEDEIRDAYNRIIENARQYNEKADIKGCILSRMAGDGVEIIIGTKIDDQFGPVIMFGIGGILVEVLRDVSFRVLPISRTAPKKMVSEIRSFPILNGVRGRPPVDKQAIYSLLLTISEIIEAYPQIQEMDLNPVIAHEDGITVVDARIILKKQKELASGIHLI
ncbi:MAG: acetate--CoA ligase family protein [Thermodesulfobacteriota bacterium]|nr:acetate--CoA ligase family protein [Thermodesulfobacteriota bacterium]